MPCTHACAALTPAAGAASTAAAGIPGVTGARAKSAGRARHQRPGALCPRPPGTGTIPARPPAMAPPAALSLPPPRGRLGQPPRRRSCRRCGPRGLRVPACSASGSPRRPAGERVHGVLGNVVEAGRRSWGAAGKKAAAAAPVFHANEWRASAEGRGRAGGEWRGRSGR